MYKKYWISLLIWHMEKDITETTVEVEKFEEEQSP